MEAQAQATAAKRSNTEAIEVLRKLNDLGAINLQVLISKASEIKQISGGGSATLDDDPEHRICYKHYIKIGPRDEIDLVSVAAELKGLGFEVRPLATK